MVSLSSPKTQRFQNLRPIRILIIDDLRAKLQDVLNKLDNLDLVATAEDGDRALALIEILKPDVVLMDVEMPHLNGIEVIKIINQRFPEAKILALSSHEKEEYIWQIISAGAEGYILKHSPLKDLFAAIDVVYRGYSHFDVKILKKLQLVISKEPSTLNKNNLKAKFPPRQINLDDACRSIKQNDMVLKDIKPKSSRLKPHSPNRSPNLSTINAEEFLPSIGKWLTWGGLSIVTAIALAIPASSSLKYKTTVKTQTTVRPEGAVRLAQTITEGKIVNIWR